MKWKFGLAIFLVLLVVGVLVYWLKVRQQSRAFSGWKKTVGVDLEVETKDLGAMKSKLGIGDEQVRDFDTLMKDCGRTIVPAACRRWTFAKLGGTV